MESRDAQPLNPFGTGSEPTANSQSSCADFSQPQTRKFTIEIDEADGGLVIRDSDGRPVIDRTTIASVKEQNEPGILSFVTQRFLTLNEQNEQLRNIFLDTPAPTNHPAYERRRFEEAEPALYVTRPFLEAPPEPQNRTALGVLQRLVPGAKRRHEIIEQEKARRYSEEFKMWKSRGREHDDLQKTLVQDTKTFHNLWVERRNLHEAKEDAAAAEFLRRLNADPDFMESMLEAQFEIFNWPFPTNVSCEVLHLENLVKIDVDLPEIDQTPSIEWLLDVKEKRLKRRIKSARKIREDYARHAHGIAMRAAGIAFATLPSCLRVLISSYTQRLDTSTGNIIDDYLLSFLVDREKFSEINFDNLSAIDPIEAMGRFPNARKMTKTGIFKSIVPLEA